MVVQNFRHKGMRLGIPELVRRAVVEQLQTLCKCFVRTHVFWNCSSDPVKEKTVQSTVVNQ